jgi:thioredoxin-like negative regulator of GroEL
MRTPLAALPLALALALAAAPAPAAPAADPLPPALAAAARDGRPVLVLFQAEWCEPCNELEASILEARQGAGILAQVHLVRVDFESELGQARSKQLLILGLPTTLVLLPRAAAPGYQEIERIEGFDDAPSWVSTIDAALKRRGPNPQASCDAWRGQPGPAHWDLVPCAVAALRQQGLSAGAAAWLEPYTRAAPRTEAERGRALEATRALSRYALRVRGDAARCADLAARGAALAAGRRQQASFVYWQAQCLGRAGRAREAAATLGAWLAARGGAAPKERREARLLAADLLVHERLAPERARRELERLVADDPRDDEAQYLTARLMRDTGQLAAARAAIARARALAPGKALYRHFEERLGK